MPVNVRFSQEDLLGGKELKPGLRKLKVKSVSEAPGSKDPESTTYPIKLVVEEGPDAGVPINHWFSEKQMFRLVEFLKCFTGGVADVNKEYTLDDVVGKSVMAQCGYDIKTGFNSISAFSPVKKSQAV